MSYAPRDGSIAWKVIQFLTTNPDEALTADDVSAKYDTARNNIHTLLSPAVQAGLLVRREDAATGELVYTLGAGHPDIKASATRAPSLRSEAPAQAAPKKRRGPFWVDVTKVEVSKGVPIPGHPGCSVDWPSLFGRMDVGDSFAVSADGLSSVRRGITAYAKDTGRRFLVREMGDQACVWRLA